MLLRKFQAHGFKSFADKMEMELGPGVTVIVGPNGCGKSNISDAIRWALGEQNIRNLRGTKMEDVIFAGSSGRRPLGVAEVSLVFDNSDGLLALDYNEVTITRRVFRTGDSEYFINKTPCRLKDIHDLLSGTGLGRDAMAVIGQNKIDEVLNNKAEDRRLLFEEAAGITKYKQRKKDALRKLDETEQNLLRVTDITAEIENQLTPLAESAKRTTRYNELCRELTAYQVTLVLQRLSKAEKMMESADLEGTALGDEQIRVTTRIAVVDMEQERLLTELSQSEEQVANFETSINQSNTDIERIEGKVAVLAERIDQGKRAEERLNQDTIRLRQKTSELQLKCDEANKKLASKKQQEAEMKEVLREKNSDYQILVSTVQRIEQQLTVGQEKTFDHLQQIVNARNESRTIERDLDTLKRRQSEFSTELQDYVNQLAHTELLNSNFLAERESLQQLFRDYQEKYQQLYLKKQHTEKLLHELSLEKTGATNQLNESASRLKILAGMQQEYEGFGRGSKSVLKNDAPWSKNICGAVAQVITVPDQYVTAVEIALGGALQYVITEDDETAKQGINFLKQQNVGRATFLPLNTIKPSRPRDVEISGASANGAIGLAASLVSCDPRYRVVVEFLLGRTIVAKDIDAALRIAKQASFTIKVVTLDGQVVNPGGSMTGGSIHRRETSYLSRHNEIEVLQEALEKIKSAIQILQTKLDATNASLSDSMADLAVVEKARQASEVRQAELGAQAEKIQEDRSRIKLAIGTVEGEFATCQREQGQLANKLLEVNNTLVILENLDVEHKNQVTNWQETLKELQEKKEVLNEYITNLKINDTAVSQEISAVGENCRLYEQERNSLHLQLGQLENEQRAITEQITQSNVEMTDMNMLHSTHIAQRAEFERQRDATYAVKLNIVASLQKTDKEIKELRRKLQDIETRLHEIQLIATKYSYEVTYCQEQLRDNFLITVEQAQSLYRQEAHGVITACIQELETNIMQLGAVNPSAIEEYSKLQERYDFLQNQYQDLVEAKEYLSSIIKDIDHTMSKQFKAAFQTINAHFGDIFLRLFGGGKAHLALVEPEDLLNTGIEIIVEPPGKKQQNLTLLSGGERALTVIALLFAFLQYRPAPFCVVDEIDAALDEANLQRFCSFLRDYAAHTQFIVVTHRKGTMEVGDVMHGVTMEEAGISKFISVKFMNQAG